MKKLTLLIGAGIGYVLGSRAGRERYDQIAEKAGKLWGDPRVQQKVEDVRSHTPEMVSKVGDTAKSAADRAKSKVTGQESTGTDGTYENATGSLDGDGEAAVDATGYGPGGEKLP